MFTLQHRLNTRQRNSVLKLKVATNCPNWDTRIGIIRACSEEVIADHEHGGGRPHWAILEDLGVRIGLKRADIQAAKPLPSTQLCWNAWEGLMASRHWLEGIVANTCAERTNVPGYGTGIFHKPRAFGGTNAKEFPILSFTGRSGLPVMPVSDLQAPVSNVRCGSILLKNSKSRGQKISAKSGFN